MLRSRPQRFASFVDGQVRPGLSVSGGETNHLGRWPV